MIYDIHTKDDEHIFLIADSLKVEYGYLYLILLDQYVGIFSPGSWKQVSKAYTREQQENND